MSSRRFILISEQSLPKNIGGAVADRNEAMKPKIRSLAPSKNFSIKIKFFN